MPFLYAEAYMAPFFGGVDCPEALNIPVGDATAWAMYPGHNHVYNKIWLCRTQGIAHAPLPIAPPSFPVFVKPITNLLGMSIGSFRADDAGALAEYRAGTFWMALLTGRQISTDVAVVNGAARWFAHTQGHPIDNGRFSHWERLNGDHGALDGLLARWTAQYLAGFTGIVNFETIGERIIECHLRMSVEFIPLYGAGWLDAVVRLYDEGVLGLHGWRLSPLHRAVLHRADAASSRPRRAGVDRGDAGIYRVYPTINDGMPELGNAPNGYRRAVIVAYSLEAGQAALTHIAEAIRPVER